MSPATTLCSTNFRKYLYFPKIARMNNFIFLPPYLLFIHYNSIQLKLTKFPLKVILFNIERRMINSSKPIVKQSRKCTHNCVHIWVSFRRVYQ